MTGNNTVVIEKQPPSSKLEPTTLPKVNVVGKKGYDTNDPYNEDYTVTKSSSATKTDTPIMETPISIQTITQQIIEDRKVTRALTPRNGDAKLKRSVASLIGIRKIFMYLLVYSAEMFFHLCARLWRGKREISKYLPW